MVRGVGSLSLGWAVLLLVPGQARAADANAIAVGKAVFSEKCAKCHDEDASHPLPDGRSLLDRLRPKPDLAAALSGRIKDLPEEKRQGVVAYVASLLEKSAPKGAPPPKGP
jgi:mono/diheme cytochrome c family protein